MAKKTQEPARPKGWDKAESCRDDLTALAQKFFGNKNVTDWMAQLEKHVASGQDFTGYEAHLNENFPRMSVADRTRLFFEEIVARCLFSVADVVDDGETADEGRRIAPPWGARELRGMTFHKAKLEMRPKGYAKVKYMGQTYEPEVPGMIGINCVVHSDGEPYRKPTVLFVSKPFHQYRAVNIRS